MRGRSEWCAIEHRRIGVPGGVYQAGAKRWVGVKGSNGRAEAGSGDFCESRGAGMRASDAEPKLSASTSRSP